MQANLTPEKILKSHFERLSIAAPNVTPIEFRSEDEIENDTGEKRNFLKIFFDIFKKFIDVIDDVWAAIRGFLPLRIFTMIGPFLTGGIGLTVHLAEAYQGIKEAWHARYKNTFGQRKTRGIIGLFIFILGCVGAGLSISLVASAFGAAVSGAALIPALIPAFLVSIYSLAFIKRAYIFYQAKIEERKADINLKETINSISNLTDTATQKEVIALHKELAKNNANDKHYREERLLAERNLAFSTIEATAFAIILTGTILGMSFIMGAATLATLGIAPLCILVSGVAIGFACKIFERIDEKHEFKYTRAIRCTTLELMAKMPANPISTILSHPDCASKPQVFPLTTDRQYSNQSSPQSHQPSPSDETSAPRPTS